MATDGNKWKCMNERNRTWNLARFPPCKAWEWGSGKKTGPGASAASAAWPFSGVSVGSCSQQTWSMLQNLLDCHQFLYGQSIVIQALKRHKNFTSQILINWGFKARPHTDCVSKARPEFGLLDVSFRTRSQGSQGSCEVVVFGCVLSASNGWKSSKSGLVLIPLLYFPTRLNIVTC